MAKNATTGIKTADQANKTLGLIAHLEAVIGTEKAKLKVALAKAQEGFELATKVDAKSLELYIAELEEYAIANAELIGKSQDLPNGTIGFRALPESVVYDVLVGSKENLEKMKKKDVDLFERVVLAKYEVSKSAVKLYIKQFGARADKVLERYGITQSKGEYKFYFKTKPSGE